MNSILATLREPWPWYVAGPLIGLLVPALLLLGNKSFGISSTLRHFCAACVPANIPFFKYNWRKETWNIFFVFGILLGGLIASTVLKFPGPIEIDPGLRAELNQYGITQIDALVPLQVFNFQNLFTLQGFLLMIGGGFLVGFGTRYAGGCTSGHSIMGISTLQSPSIVATVCFMIGGFITANLILPYILQL